LAAPAATAAQTWEVPEGKYFLLADDPQAARDSRQLGAIPRDQILGLVSRP
jgi:type IV secretory pathway protease TraF